MEYVVYGLIAFFILKKIFFWWLDISIEKDKQREIEASDRRQEQLHRDRINNFLQTPELAGAKDAVVSYICGEFKSLTDDAHVETITRRIFLVDNVLKVSAEYHRDEKTLVDFYAKHIELDDSIQFMPCLKEILEQEMGFELKKDDSYGSNGAFFITKRNPAYIAPKVLKM